MDRDPPGESMGRSRSRPHRALPLGIGARWSLPWLPFVVPLSFVVTVWSGAQIDFAWLLRPVLLVTVGMAIVTLLCCSFSHPEFGTAGAISIGAGLVVDDLRLTAFSFGIAAVLLVIGRAARRERTPLLRRGLRTFSVVALALIAITIGGTLVNGSLPNAVNALSRDVTLDAPSGPVAAGSPDIWLILLDGYPGDDAAAELDPAWDRHALPSALSALGFDVQRHSRTNYPLTRLVLPAMFNGRHVRDLVANEEGTGNLASQTRLLRSALEDSVVLRSLGAAGYERIAISSGWAEVGPRRVDRLIDPPQLTEFEVGLLRASAVGGLLHAVVPDIYSDQMRDRIDTTVREAMALSRERHQRPRFVIMHLPSPHPPVVLDATGLPVNGSPSASVASGSEPSPADGTAIMRQLGAVQYVGHLVEALVREIQGSATRPAAIIVFSDHGTDIHWDANDPLSGGVNERTSNLLAVSLPGHPQLLPPGTTPVNVLVRVLNGYGIADLPVREDSTWSYLSPGSLTDVVRIDPETGELR